MQKYLQEICLKLKDNLEYEYNGTSENGIWKDGELISKTNDTVYEVKNGIPRFVKSDEETWGTEEEVKNSEDLKYWLDKSGITNKELIESNFEKSFKDEGLYDFLKPDIDQMLATNGIILECACGPAGGLTPLILKADPNAKIIMNEKSYWLLSEWHRLNQKKGFKNLSFALFDLTNSPLKENSFDMISSWFGVSNIGGDTQLGLNECYRILKNNGKMFLYEIEISEETLSILTENKLKDIKEVIEGSKNFGTGSYDTITTMIQDNLHDQITKAGFKNVKVEPMNQQKPDPKDGDVPGIFHEAGIELIYNLKKFTAEK